MQNLFLLERKVGIIMDSQVYKEYFSEQLLPNIPPNTIIGLDNASIWSVKREYVKMKSTTEAVIQEWLTSKNINWDPSMNKLELVKLVNRVRLDYDKHHQIDKLAEDAGHKVLSLLPYHCELNSVESVWNFKLPEVH